MILAGLILPFLYLASTVFMFSEPGTVAMIVVVGFSLLCIGTGIWIFAKNV
jgi:hypothetical protein